LIVAVELPKGASLERTDRVILRATEIIRETSGATRAIGFAGFSGATFSNASNAGAIFVGLKPFSERGPGDSANEVLGRLWNALAKIREAQIFVIAPPPVRGLGNGGGFKMMVQDRRGRGLQTLEQATWGLVSGANQLPQARQVFSTFSTGTPRYYLDIDRTRAEMLQVPVANVFEALQVYLGSAYVNDFNLFGRTYRVTAQADEPYRLEPADIMRLRARNTHGGMVPLGSVLEITDTTGSDRLVRHNLYPAAEVQGSTAAGYSSGEAIAEMERLAGKNFPLGIEFVWSELAFHEQHA
jgi:multidrug efflux pump